MSIGTTLRLLTKATGLTVTDLATAIPRVGVSTVSAWLKDEKWQEVLRDPDPEILRAFFQAVLENPERLAETDVVNAFVNWLLEP